MSYLHTHYYLTFDALPLSDAIGGTVTTTGTIALVDGIFSNALPLEGVTVTRTSPINLTGGAFSIGFWLKPVNQGLANVSTSDPLHQALICQGEMSYSGGLFTPVSPTIIVYEKTQQGNQNKLIVDLTGLNLSSVGVSAILTSTAYDCDEWHHFFINYSGGATPTLTLHVDAVLDSAVTTGTVPNTIQTSTSKFYINKLAPGYTYQAVENVGILDDLVVFNRVRTSTEIQRIANMGAIFVANDSYSNIEEIHQPFVVDDPSTVQVTSVFANRGNIYVGRTDGKLLRGVRSLWESRHEFSDARELDLLTVVTKTADNTLTLTDGVLTLKSETIRI